MMSALRCGTIYTFSVHLPFLQSKKGQRRNRSWSRRAQSSRTSTDRLGVVVIGLMALSRFLKPLANWALAMSWPIVRLNECDDSHGLKLDRSRSEILPRSTRHLIRYFHFKKGSPMSPYLEIISRAELDANFLAGVSLKRDVVRAETGLSESIGRVEALEDAEIFVVR
jgi:hypothetical protein